MMIPETLHTPTPEASDDLDDKTSPTVPPLPSFVDPLDLEEITDVIPRATLEKLLKIKD